jgi:HlyD family secretion protein
MDVEALIYVPASYGKKVRVGMEVQLMPSTVRREEYGFMLAEVRYVSDYPASSESMLAILQNRQMAQELSGGIAPIEVRARPIRGQTRSGFRWSSGDGPPFTVGAGTLGSAEIIVDRQAPITLVVPLLRKSLALD